jgi:hypothetical protein
MTLALLRFNVLLFHLDHMCMTGTVVYFFEKLLDGVFMTLSLAFDLQYFSIYASRQMLYSWSTQGTGR